MFDWKITPGVVFHTIQSRLCKKWSNAGTLALMLAEYLRDRHSTCTLHWWGYLVSHCMPNLLWERDKTRYICIYTNNWLSFMHGLPIFSSQAIILHRSRINCYIHSIHKTLMEPSISFLSNFIQNWRKFLQNSMIFVHYCR